MKPSEEITQLKKELALAQEQIRGLQQKLKEQEDRGISKPSRSRQQAEAALELLKQGPVSVEQLKALNSKYPSDCIYYCRTILKQDVKTVRVPGKGSLYMLPGMFQTYTEGIQKEKAAREVAAKEAKEEVSPATTSVEEAAQAAA